MLLFCRQKAEAPDTCWKIQMSQTDRLMKEKTIHARMQAKKPAEDYYCTLFIDNYTASAILFNKDNILYPEKRESRCIMLN